MARSSSPNSSEHVRRRNRSPKCWASSLTVIAQKDVRALVDRLQSIPGSVLIVGHSNTVPEIIKALGVAEPISIAETEFDNLFIVLRSATPSLLRLHYR